MSDDMRAGLLAQEENSFADLREFFTKGTRPFAEKEFIEFWQSLTYEEKAEFKKADLSQMR